MRIRTAHYVVLENILNLESIIMSPSPIHTELIKEDLVLIIFGNLKPIDSNALRTSNGSMSDILLRYPRSQENSLRFYCCRDHALSSYSDSILGSK